MSSFRTATTARRTRTARLGLDVLEARCVPAMLLDAQGTLSITGTTAMDDVHVKILANTQVPTLQVIHKVNGAMWEAKNFLLDKVKLVKFDGLANKDVFFNQTNVRCNANGGAGDDKLTSLGGADVLVGGDGNDTLSGGAGKDVLSALAGDDYCYGGDGDDVVNGGLGADHLYGDKGNDAMNGDADLQGDGTSEGDYLFGGDGNDVMQGMAGTDYVYGEAGNDMMWNAAKAASNISDSGFMFGGDGDDVLTVSSLAGCFVSGGLGNDTLTGNAGNDEMYGDGGADVLYGYGGNDSLDAGYQFSTGQLVTGDGADKVYGGEGNDTIEGGDGNDLLVGQDGSDTISGQAGDDTLDGGDGADTMVGGAGADTMKAGASDGNVDKLTFDPTDILLELEAIDETIPD